MREFVEGTQLQFDNLKRSLEDDRLHVYHNCQLPESCSRRACRIGFEKDAGMYVVYIDEGITCSRRGFSFAMKQFRQWLEQGEIRFLDFNDVRDFFRNLRVLYKN